MSTDLQLFRVTVTQIWRAEADVLVMAPDEESAFIWARCKVEFDMVDAEEGDKRVGMARPEPMDTLMSLTPQKADDLCLILPIAGRPLAARTVELDEFLAELCPERLEALRRAACECDNGQLALLEVA